MLLKKLVYIHWCNDTLHECFYSSMGIKKKRSHNWITVSEIFQTKAQWKLPSGWTENVLLSVFYVSARWHAGGRLLHAPTVPGRIVLFSLQPTQALGSLSRFNFCSHLFAAAWFPISCFWLRLLRNTTVKKTKNTPRQLDAQCEMYRMAKRHALYTRG